MINPPICSVYRMHVLLLCSAGCSWWLVLICCEKKILLAGWWLVLIWCEKNTIGWLQRTE